MTASSRRAFLRRAVFMGVASGVVPLLGACTAAAPREGSGQVRLVRVGMLGGGTGSPDFEGLVDGLRDLGYAEGRNLVIERRFTAGRPDLLPAAAADLVRLGVDAIVVSGPAPARVAKSESGTIPILTSRAWIESGIMDSYTRPGGNITGIDGDPEDLEGKRLEVFKEVVPSISHVAVLGSNITAVERPLQDAALLLGLQLTVLPLPSPEALEPAFQATIASRADGLYVRSGGIQAAAQERIVEFAAERRLPAVYEIRRFVEGGGLLLYGVNGRDVFRRLAVYVDKILRGAKPGELPVERPTAYDLVINLKAAQGLGLVIPPAVLARATEVIR